MVGRLGEGVEDHWYVNAFQQCLMFRPTSRDDHYTINHKKLLPSIILWTLNMILLMAKVTTMQCQLHRISVVIDETTNQSTHHYKASLKPIIILPRITNTHLHTKLTTVDADNQYVRQPRVSSEMMMLV